MTKLTFVLFLMSAAIMCLGPTVLAVPQQINYQGFLTAVDGTPLDTTVAMNFRIYAMADGGDMLWIETHPSVVVTDGLFHVLLGSVTPLSDLFSDIRWLEIQVGSDLEMTPRQQIVSVAHSYRVGTVDGASGGTLLGELHIQGNLTAGFGNVASGLSSSVTGGGYNIASGVESHVGGGGWNNASGYRAAVLSGWNNTASGPYSVILGGQGNCATGGDAVAAGYFCNAASRSVAFGTWASAAEGGFTWADATPAPFEMTIPNRFGVRATGGAAFYTNANLTSGVFLNSGGSAWGSVSDSTRKRNIRPTDTRSVLDKLAALPIKDWEYKSEKEGTRHMGPMAQDLWNAFHLGSDSLRIETIDADGVMMAAIQELAKQNEELRNQLSGLRAQFQSHLANEQQTSDTEQ